MSEFKESTSKPRRQLPAIPVQNAPETQLLQPTSETAVATATFYATPPSTSTFTNQQPPPLPARNQNTVGSSHTTYVPDPTFREPELVTDDNWQDQSRAQWDPNNENATWGDQQPGWVGADNWASIDNTPWGGLYSRDWGNSMTVQKVEIDGRSEDEELQWWIPDVRQIHRRSGSGLLPTLLETFLHDSDHSLYSVTATPPETKASRHRSSPSAATASEGSSTPSSHHPPSAEEVRTAIPHPNAYYCRRHNSWVLVMWKSSSVDPPIAKSYVGPPLPDQLRRRRTSSCIEEGVHPFGQMNRTHHFHYCQNAVDSSKLNAPFRRSNWDSPAKSTKLLRRQGVVLSDNESRINFSGGADDDLEGEGELLDLFVCCQCSFYVVVSEIIPGVVPVKLLEDLTQERTLNPQVGKGSEVSVSIAWETIMMIIENRLWKGENRALPVYRNSFQSKLGWSPTSQAIFDHIGFSLEPMHSQNELALHPPSIDPSTLEGAANRAKLLRAWIEIGAWLSDYYRRYAPALREHKEHISSKIWVKTDAVRELYQSAIGAHPEQIPRNNLPHSLLRTNELEQQWRLLGLTATSYSWELLTFAYLAQCRCHPQHTPDYFTALFQIVETMQRLSSPSDNLPPTELQNLVMEERSRGRFTRVDYAHSVRLLGFGHDGVLGVDFDDGVEDEFIINAWKDCIRRSWHSTAVDGGAEARRDLNDAFKIIFEMRGSEKMKTTWEKEKGSVISVETAYSTLGVSKEMDETTLITVYVMRLEESTNQSDKLKESLSVIAEVMDSARLRSFLDTGIDPGIVITPTPPNMPRGLNQLGNTCYLNSLLQYFYTIKDLRDAVTAISNVDMKTVDLDKSSEDDMDLDLDRHRVGGRLVTKREIARSRKFVNQLANLFWNLECCEIPAVTPTVELAKLALVTSKDEEDDEGDKGGTDSSNDTDATLVDDAPPRFTAPSEQMSPKPKSPSVLGKRSRTHTIVMDVDGAEADKDKDYVMVSKPNSPGSLRDATPPQSAQPSVSRSKSVAEGDGDVDVEMNETSKAVKPVASARKNSESVMMFGRQHDVAECMDSCLFQLECAELIRSSKLSGTTSSELEKSSIVKRLFYGKIKQRVTPDSPTSSRVSIHEKEDLFSHLPVNVSEEGFDIYDGLSRYFHDTVEFEGKKARMEVGLVELPPLLQIQLQRVQFDRDQLQAFKSQAYVKFWETISMDRFLEDANQLKKARSKTIQESLNVCRERIRQLTESKYAPYQTPLEVTDEWLTRQDVLDLPEVDEEFLFNLSLEQDHVCSSLEQLRTTASNLKQSLEEIWKNEQEALYELTSVFIHRGDSPSWGHYFFYSRHLPEDPDSWFKYNDSDVSVVSKDEVLRDTTGENANPYLLVFARKGADVIQTVKRLDVSSLEEVPAAS